MADRVLTSTSNTTVFNTNSTGVISIDVDLSKYRGVTNSSSITCGNTSINSTTLHVGEVTISATNLSIGTSQGGSGNGALILNSDNIILGNVIINTTSVDVGWDGFGNGGILVGYTGNSNHGQIICGNVVVNESIIEVGWDGVGNGILISEGVLQTGQVTITSTNLMIGTYGAGTGLIMNQDNILLGGGYLTINTSIVAVSGGGFGTQTQIANNYIKVGNTTVLNTTAINVGNNSDFSIITEGYIICQAYANGGNSNTFISPTGIYVGNSTLHTQLDPTRVSTVTVLTDASNVGNLPAENLRDGLRAFVNDSTLPLANNAGGNVAGGGNNHVPVYYDGGANTWRLG